MEIKKNLHLVDVKKNENQTHAELLFMDFEENKIYSVKFNQQKWDKQVQKFVDSEEKAKQTDENLMKEIGVNFDDLLQAIGQKHDIYVYAELENPFCSLWECNNIAKPDEEFFQKYRGGVLTEIESVEDTGERIRILFTIDGQKYASSNSTCGLGNVKLRYGEWIDQHEKFYPNALLEKKAFENFEKIFNLKFEEKDKLIGQKITIFPAKAGKNFYIEFQYLLENKDMPF